MGDAMDVKFFDRSQEGLDIDARGYEQLFPDRPGKAFHPIRDFQPHPFEKNLPGQGVPVAVQPAGPQANQLVADRMEEPSMT